MCMCVLRAIYVRVIHARGYVCVSVMMYECMNGVSELFVYAREVWRR
jgi:hypothetical protein